MENRIALGLDVSKLKVDVCLLFPDGKKLTTKIANSRAGFVELLSWLNGIELTTIHACLEPTGRYSRPLAYFLCDAGIQVSLVNSFAVQSHGRSKKFRSKSDRIDAFLLADYCLKHCPEAWEPPSVAYNELRDLQHRLTSIDEMIRQEENRLEAGTDSRTVYQDIEDSLGRLYVRRKNLQKAAKELICKDGRLSQNFAILNSIIGIGEKSAIQMLAGLQFEQFENGRKVACFAGLSPQNFDSGTTVHKPPRISKIGNSQLRAALYFPAMVAMQHNPQLREFAERLRARNKPPKVIICAVMRKLLVLSSALIRKQEMYNPDYEPASLVVV
jgi:transposase